MNLWKPLAIASTSALVLVVGYSSIATASANGASATTAVQGGQPHMESARDQLKAAHASLAAAEHNKGGWRAAALAATETAIKETDRGIAFPADK